MVYAQGCSAHGNDASGMAEAIGAAESADVVVVGLGLCGLNYAGEDPACPEIDEAEANERTSIELPGLQLELLQNLVATGKRVVLFLLNAGSVDVTWAKEHVDAIVWAGYPGELGGAAVANVLLGKTNPGGALPLTWYTQALMDKSSITDMAMRPSAHSPGRTYRFLPSAPAATTATSDLPLWPFGHSESYTTFKVAVVGGAGDGHGAGGGFGGGTGATHDGGVGGMIVFNATHKEQVVEVLVTNTGKVVGDKIVMLFAKAVEQTAVKVPPLRTLVGFERAVAIAPAAFRGGGSGGGGSGSGEARKVSFTVTASMFDLVNEDGVKVTAHGSTHKLEIGGDGAGSNLVVNVKVE